MQFAYSTHIEFIHLEGVNLPTQSAVTISDLTVKFGNVTIIPHLNLELKPGQLIGLLGPSGSGKTTLVKAIMGMNKFSGNIKIFNQDVPSLKLCKQIGYMAQNDALYEDLSAMDNLLFFSSMFGLKGRSFAACKRNARFSRPAEG